MSQEQEIIKAFFEKIESDKDLQSKLRRLGNEHERRGLGEVVEIASEAGFEFTVAELAKVRAKQVRYFPGLAERQEVEECTWCCHYAQGCMPYFHLAPE